MQRIRLFLVTAVLLAAVWLGIKEGFDGFTGAESQFQRAAGVFQILYGLAAVAALVGLFAYRPLLRPALAAWVLTITITGAISPVVWAGGALWAGALSGALTALVGGLVAWGALAHARTA